MRTFIALIPMLIGVVMIIVAGIMSYQTMLSIKELLFEINLNTDVTRDIIGLQVSIIGVKASISLGLHGTGLAIFAIGLAYFLYRSSNWSIELLLASLHSVDQRLEKIEKSFIKNGNKEQ